MGTNLPDLISAGSDVNLTPMGHGRGSHLCGVAFTVLIWAAGGCDGKSTSHSGGGGSTADAAVEHLDAGAGTGGSGAGGTGTGGLGAGGAAVGGAGASGSGGGGNGGRGGAGSGGNGGGGNGQTRSCPGYVAPMGTPCRSSAECFGSICTATPSPPGCGFQSQPMRLCNGDVDCANGGFCQPAKTKAPCATGPDIVCVPRCTATSCAAGERCGADGHCEVFPCAEGFACPAGRTCAPTRTGVDVNGCAVSSCATDGWACSLAHTHCDPMAKNGVDAHGCAPDTCDTGAFTCGANRACGAPGDVNGCHCTSDAACGVNTRCDAATGLCAVKSCAGDTDCDCGVCINQTCQPGLWACQMQAA